MLPSYCQSGLMSATRVIAVTPWRKPREPVRTVLRAIGATTEDPAATVSAASNQSPTRWHRYGTHTRAGRQAAIRQNEGTARRRASAKFHRSVRTNLWNCSALLRD